MPNGSGVQRFSVSCVQLIVDSWSRRGLHARRGDEFSPLSSSGGTRCSERPLEYHQAPSACLCPHSSSRVLKALGQVRQCADGVEPSRGAAPATDTGPVLL